MENGAQMDYTWYPVYDRIVSQIDELLAKEKNRPVTVAIDGMCGSGKSTLGQALKDHYGCNLFHMDDFYLRMEAGERRNDSGAWRQCGLECGSRQRC